MGNAVCVTVVLANMVFKVMLEQGVAAGAWLMWPHGMLRMDINVFLESVFDQNLSGALEFPGSFLRA